MAQLGEITIEVPFTFLFKDLFFTRYKDFPVSMIPRTQHRGNMFAKTQELSFSTPSNNVTSIILSYNCSILVHVFFSVI